MKTFLNSATSFINGINFLGSLYAAKETVFLAAQRANSSVRNFFSSESTSAPIPQENFSQSGAASRQIVAVPPQMTGAFGSQQAFPNDQCPSQGGSQASGAGFQEAHSKWSMPSFSNGYSKLQATVGSVWGYSQWLIGAGVVMALYYAGKNFFQQPVIVNNFNPRNDCKVSLQIQDSKASARQEDDGTTTFVIEPSAMRKLSNQSKQLKIALQKQQTANKALEKENQELKKEIAALRSQLEEEKPDDEEDNISSEGTEDLS